METVTNGHSPVSVAPNGPTPGTYSPVTVHQDDTIGAIFLGITALALIIAFVRAEARQRALLAQLAALRAAPPERSPRSR
jgi:hypothetical protein